MSVEIDVDPEVFARHWCRGEAQYWRASEQERKGLPPGQNMEALRTELAWLKNKLPSELVEQINRSLERYGIPYDEPHRVPGETGKPPGGG